LDWISRQVFDFVLKSSFITFPQTSRSAPDVSVASMAAQGLPLQASFIVAAALRRHN
jgi:hypothetical protein